MDDLVSKYFREDLTETEDQALSEMLRNSPEDSLRIEALAEAAYRRYGLPEPQWPGDPNDWPRPKPGFKTRMWFGFLLMGAAAIWFFWRTQTNMIKSLSPVIGSKESSLAARPGGLSSLGTQKITPPRLKKNSGNALDSKVGGDFTRSPAPGKPGKSVYPIDLSLQPHRAHTDLEVVIQWPKPGPVTVRVLTLDGTQMALLYQGLLQKGKWAFDWDGRLANGNAATAGHYQILVESSLGSQSKNIVIRKRGSVPP